MCHGRDATQLHLVSVLGCQWNQNSLLELIGMKRFCVTGMREKHIQSKNNTTVVVQDPTNEWRVWHDTVFLSFGVVCCVIVFEELTHE